jgi:flagellar biosynthetic protein FliR
MTVDSAFMWAFFSVFVRASAMMLSSPFFGAQSTPVSIRIMTTLAISGALSYALMPSMGPPPENLYVFAVALANEAVAGLLIGAFASLAFSAFQYAGSLLDLQIGLGSSHVMNPVDGIPSTLMSQFKSTLAIVIFLMMSGHHMLVRAFMSSYQLMPVINVKHAAAIQSGMVEMVGQTALIGLQIAAPVLAVSLVVDAALGLVNKAVPQMPVMLVGLPAKLGLGLIALSVGLPALVASVNASADLAASNLNAVFRAGK